MNPLSSRAALALVALVLLCAPPAAAAPVSGQITEVSDLASYQIWVTSSLDLATADQPLQRIDVGPDGRWQSDIDAAPFWLFMHQRFQPVGGPPVELFLPIDLLPFAAAPTEPVLFPGVDPELVFVRTRFDTAWPVLRKWLLAVLIVFGSGFGLRFALRGLAAPQGRRSAPLADRGEPPPIARRERGVVLALLAVALALRSWGFADQALDLLEVSYLPGIGRPAQFAGGASGFSQLPHMLDELARLYSIDLVHPPLYHAVMGVFGLFGDGEWLLRLPALASSLWTGWMLWALLRRWSPAAGIAALAVFTIASPAVYFGQDATPYATVGLVALGSVLALLRALEQGTNRHWWAYFGWVVGGFFCHYNVALMAVGQLGLLCVVAWRGRSDRRWGAAVHRALKPTLILAPLPVGWSWIHFSTFPTIAQDTRLVADTYAVDPGFVSFAWDFTKVTGGVPADGPGWAAVVAVGLMLLGMHRLVVPGPRSADVATPPREIGLLVVVMTLSFFASVGFFYVNVKAGLGGKVFYGFRWVGWFHPVMLGLCALGAVRGLGPWPLRALLVVAWMAGVVPGTVDLFRRSARPDYERASRLILDELQDRDALATLPAWFQRGNLSHYLLQQAGRVERRPEEGEGVWVLDNKRLTIEAIHPSLPFESSALSTHYERLWVAVVDEQMSGRSKFSEPVATQAIAWADEHLVPDGEWAFDRLTLHRYRVPQEALHLGPGQSFVANAADAITNWRTYPPLNSRTRPTFVPPGDIAPRDGTLGRTASYHAPTTPGCVDWAFDGLPAHLEPKALGHWYLELRFPLDPGEPLPRVEALTPAQYYARREGGDLRVSAAGMPCTEPPLRVKVTAATP